MSAWPEIAFVAALTVLWPLYDALTFERTKSRMAAAALGKRGFEYLRPMLLQWAVAAFAIALTLAYGRPLASIGLLPPSGLGLLWSAGVLALVGVLLVLQSRAATGSERGKSALRSQLASLSWLLPRDEREMSAFLALSVTAGICEEILFRGYLLSFLVPRTGVFAALLLAALSFGLMHAYQGARGIVRTGVVGFCFGLMYLVTGSLAAPMVAHALVDWSGGRLATRLAATDRAGASSPDANSFAGG